MSDSHHRPFTSPTPRVPLIQATDPGIMLPCSVSTLNHHPPHPPVPLTPHAPDPSLLPGLTDPRGEPHPGGEPLVAAEPINVPDLAKRSIAVKYPTPVIVINNLTWEFSTASTAIFSSMAPICMSTASNMTRSLRRMASSMKPRLCILSHAMAFLLNGVR